MGFRIYADVFTPTTHLFECGAFLQQLRYGVDAEDEEAGAGAVALEKDVQLDQRTARREGGEADSQLVLCSQTANVESLHT